MTSTPISPTTFAADVTGRARTRTLLLAGAVAGPAYIVVALAQSAFREGFDLTRHQWSLLTLGSYGWIQIANLVITGVLIVAGAIGLRRELSTGRGSRWTPRLLGVFGVSLVAAGVFRPDPALGFPVGTPEGPGAISWHGMVHFAAAGVGFTCLAVASFVIARRYATEGRRGYALFSRITGIAFLAGFACVASGAGSVVANLAFTAAVLLVFSWLTAVALDRRRHIAENDH